LWPKRPMHLLVPSKIHRFLIPNIRILELRTFSTVLTKAPFISQIKKLA
jgi:hypothetical protein